MRSAFGVEHQPIEKAAWGTARRALSTGLVRGAEGASKAKKVAVPAVARAGATGVRRAQQGANYAGPKIKEAGRTARGFSQGLRGQMPTSNLNAAATGQQTRNWMKANPLKTAGGAAAGGATTAYGMKPKRRQ